MLRISEKSLGAFQQDAKDRFETRALDYLQSRLKTTIDPAQNAEFLAEALRYGISSERHIVRYLLIAHLAQLAQDASRSSWTDAVMAGAGAPEYKMRMLYKAAQERFADK
jgi:hypothetical protein